MEENKYYYYYDTGDIWISLWNPGENVYVAKSLASQEKKKEKV